VCHCEERKRRGNPLKVFTVSLILILILSVYKMITGHQKEEATSFAGGLE